jgi:hypothetical protein
MTLQDRDRRALTILAVAVIGIALWYWLQSSGGEAAEAAAAVESVDMAERRLNRLRQIAAGVPGRETALKQVSTELGQREQGLILADTAAQAQAQIVQVVRRLARAQTPPIDLRSTEVGQVKAYGDDYGEVAVLITFDARIEQLINLVSDIMAQKEILSTSELHIGQAHPKEKTMSLRMTVSGLVPKSLIPDKKKGTF